MGIPLNYAIGGSLSINITAVKLESCKLEDNTAVAGLGGAISMGNSTFNIFGTDQNDQSGLSLTLEDTEFDDNSPDDIYAPGVPVTVEGEI